jgi:hypothetical protein
VARISSSFVLCSTIQFFKVLFQTWFIQFDRFNHHAHSGWQTHMSIL